MTRAEEIQKLIDEETGIDNYGSSDYQVGLIDGVRLADETMIEKTLKWMKLLTYQEFPGAPLERLITDELIKDYLKTMNS